jgi:hypothetical protein
MSPGADGGEDRANVRMVDLVWLAYMLKSKAFATPLIGDFDDNVNTVLAFFSPFSRLSIVSLCLLPVIGPTSSCCDAQGC